MSIKIGQVWEAYCNAIWVGWSKTDSIYNDPLPLWINLSRHDDPEELRGIIDTSVQVPTIYLKCGDKFLISGRDLDLCGKIWCCTTLKYEFKITKNDLVSIARRIV